MSTYTKLVSFTIEEVECCSCGHVIFMTDDFMTRRKRDHNSWYCIACGTNQSWRGESDIDKIRRERDAYKQREETIRADLEATRKKMERLNKRVTRGVCPCCNRTFKQLATHMKNKHPELVK